jgi:hypothetical protein
VKAPAQHLEEGVVVRVLPHVVQVVVLAARADALLRVRRALQLRQRALDVPAEVKIERKVEANRKAIYQIFVSSA